MALIEVKNAIKTYQTGEDSFNALNDVSLSIECGEFVAIMGASGSGKSTFMNMLGTLDKPNSGSYFLDGIDTFAKDFLLDMSPAGRQVHFKAMRKIAAEHPVEKVGEEVRSLYSWNNEEDKFINN